MVTKDGRLRVKLEENFNLTRIEAGIVGVAEVLEALRPGRNCPTRIRASAEKLWYGSREAARYDHISMRRAGHRASEKKLDAVQRLLNKLVVEVEKLPLDALAALELASEERDEDSARIASIIANRLPGLSAQQRADLEIEERWADPDYIVAARHAPSLAFAVPRILPVIERAKELLVESPDVKDPPNAKKQALIVTEFAGCIYKELTGDDPTVIHRYNEDTGRQEDAGPFVEFLSVLYLKLGLNAESAHLAVSPSAQARAFVKRQKSRS